MHGGGVALVCIPQDVNMMGELFSGEEGEEKSDLTLYAYLCSRIEDFFPNMTMGLLLVIFLTVEFIEIDEEEMTLAD